MGPTMTFEGFQNRLDKGLTLYYVSKGPVYNVIRRKRPLKEKTVRNVQILL